MVLAALPQDTIRLIKSTQVITTPSSIVKELTENSLDAMATTVSVKLEKFGFLRLEVRDNGSGIREDDVQLIAKPHFTSKITSFSDLSSLTSYGFRGEALSSLCAVADVTVTTKRKEDPMGHSYMFNHKGEVTSKTPAAATNGTTFVVTNLFKNVPVRHQYYSNSKHCKDELKKVENILFALSIAAPSVHITFTHDKVNIFQKNSASGLQGVLMNIFPEICKNFVSRNKAIGDVTMEIFLPEQKRCSNTEYSRSSADRFFTLVNKRPVSHKQIEKTVKAYFNQGHGSCHGRYPVGFVALSVPPDDVDVNLEPNKNKVLLKDEDVILEALRGILEDLYGPLEKNKKNSTVNVPGSIEVNSSQHITCTFAGVTQLSGQPEARKVSANNKKFIIDDPLIFDDFVAPKTIQNEMKNTSVSGCNGRSGSFGNKKNLLALQTLRSETPESSRCGNLNIAPKVVVGRDEGTYDELTLREVSIERDQCQKINTTSREKVVDVRESRMASTPEKKKDENYPDLSLSTIHATGDSSDCVIRSQHIDSSTEETTKRPFSSEVKLSNDLQPTSVEVNRNSTSFYSHSAVNEKQIDSNRTVSALHHDEFDQMHKSVIGDDGAPMYKTSIEVNRNSTSFYSHPAVNEKQIDSNRTVSSLHHDEFDQMHKSVIGDDGAPMYKTSVEVNRNSTSVHSHPAVNEKQISDSNQNVSSLHHNELDQMHESIIGDDGVPVYKIAPIMPEIVEQNTMEKPQHSNDNEDIDDVRLALKHEIFGESFSVTFNQDKENADNQGIASETNRGDLMSSREIQDGGKGQGSWSRGISENGQNIQTVQLLRPQNGTLGISKNSVKKAEGKRPLSLVSSGTSENTTSPPKKKKLNSLGPASFDYVHSKPIKKPSSPFILFSRDIRSQVLAENPGADFAWVAKEMADRWKALDTDIKKHYQDMAKEDTERYQKEVRKIKEIRGLNSSLDSSLNSDMGSRTTLDKYLAPSTPQLVRKEGKVFQEQPLISKHPWKEYKKEIEVTVAMIKEKIDKRCMSTNVDDTLRLIGPLANGEGWTCLKEGVISTLNMSRLQETILCRNLFQSFKLPTSDLSDPIPFNASVIGESSWMLLIRLKREKTVGQNIFTVTDRRVTVNGFKVALYPSSDDRAVMSHGEIVGISNNVGFYGMNDFKEVLSVLAVNPSATIGQTRPLKLQFWLKGEAVRMVRLSPSLPRPEDVLEKLEMWKQIQQSLDGTIKTAWEEAKCFHNKPIFTPLYSLEELPLTQSQTQRK